MEAFVAGFGPEHIKLLFCLVLGALSFLKLSEIQDKKTHLKKSIQIDVGPQQSCPKFGGSNQQQQRASNLQQIKGQKPTEASCKCPKYEQKIKHTSQCILHTANRQSQQKEEELYPQGCDSTENQGVTLGSYMYLKYCRKMQNSNRRPLFGHTDGRQWRLRRENQQSPMDVQEINRSQIGGKAESALEEKMQQQHYETPKMSKKPDILIGIEKTDISFKKSKIQNTKVKGKRLNWDKSRKRQQHCVQASLNYQSSQQENSVDKAHKDSINLFRNRQPAYQKSKLQGPSKMNRPIIKDKSRLK